MGVRGVRAELQRNDTGLTHSNRHIDHYGEEEEGGGEEKEEEEEEMVPTIETENYTVYNC